MKLLMGRTMLKFLWLVGKKHCYMLYQKYVPYNAKMEKAEDVHEYLFKKDVELKGFDDGGAEVLYGVDF